MRDLGFGWKPRSDLRVLQSSQLMTGCTSSTTLKTTKGNADGDALIVAAKGMKWESPRGSTSIDPATRDIGQNVYLRRVEKVGNNIVNIEFDKVEKSLVVWLGWRLNNEQMASVLTYFCNTWGNAAMPVTEAAVKSQR